MADYRVWEDWPGYSDEIRSMLESIASTIYDDCQGWGEIRDDRGHTLDRVLIRGTMSRVYQAKVVSLGDRIAAEYVEILTRLTESASEPPEEVG